MTKEKIENKAFAICRILGGTNFDDIAYIMGAIFYGIISSTEEIDENKAKAFAQLIEKRFNSAIETTYNPENP